MQELQIELDGKLSARLRAFRGLLTEIDAGTAGETFVRLPQGGAGKLSLQDEEGRQALGALLTYALLGQETDSALEDMTRLEGSVRERQVRRLCTLAMELMRDAPDFSPASLYTCLRMAIAFLPQSGESVSLPGILTPEAAPASGEDVGLPARYLWAGNAAIAYFDLPEGVEDVELGGRAFNREQCRAGICLPPDVKEVLLRWCGGSGHLTPEHPLDGMKFAVGFRLRKGFVRAARTPRFLWGRLSPCVRVRGREGSGLPALTLVTSCGEVAESARALPQGECYLRCPRLNPAQDSFVEIRGVGVLYLAVEGDD